MNTTLLIVNYVFRASFILIGAYFLYATEQIPLEDPTLIRVLGAVFILFGIYRIVNFYVLQRKIARESKDQN